MPWIWALAAVLNLSVALAMGDNWFLWLTAGIAYLGVAYFVKRKRDSSPMLRRKG